MNKFLLTILLVLILFLPLFAFSAVKLEQVYPQVPGAPSVPTLSSKTSIPGLIKFFSSWAIIIAILVVIISLIVAGFQYPYLASKGGPEALGRAKSRIFNCFLGLAILVGSYLILITVNPQLTILTIEYVPVRTGIVLFTPTGYRDFMADVSIKEILDSNNGYFLHYDIPDCEKVFGDLVVEKRKSTPLYPAAAGTQEAEKVNFDDFPLYAIGFWGELEQDTKVITYPKKNFEGLTDKQFIAYTPKGKLDVAGNTLEASVPKSGMAITIIDTPLNPGFFNAKVDFYDVPDNFTDDPAHTLPPKTPNGGPVDYPPLSMKIIRTGPGIYLYSKEKEERYLTASHEDFSQETFDFDKKAEEIKIINRKDTRIHDYLAALHEKDIFAGSLRLFFEQREDKSEAIPKINQEGQPIAGFEYYPKGAQTIGNLTHNTLANINIKDRYGGVDYVSSANVFELGADPLVCKEIRLCTKEYFQGENYCISYSYKGANTQKVPEIGVAKFPMPLYLPVNIPKTAKVVSEIKKDDQGNLVIETKDVDFAGEIRSILVQPSGACLVALFEHSIKYKEVNNEWKFDGWDGNDPGAHSELFTGTENDLTDNEIGRCGSVSVNPKRWRHTPCASAIAVFPIGEPGEVKGLPVLPSEDDATEEETTPPVPLPSASTWRTALQPSIMGQDVDASDALKGLLDRIATAVPVVKGGILQWSISSISDSAGIENCLVGEYSKPPCHHSSSYSCHYGGKNCQGESYAFDLSVRYGVQGVAEQVARAACEQGADTVVFETNPDHYHISINNQACDCDAKGNRSGNLCK